MSIRDDMPEQALEEILFDANGEPLMHVDGRMYVRPPSFINSLPYTRRRRMTWLEFRQHAVENDLPEPTRLDWFETFKLTRDEIELRLAISEMVHAALFDEIAKYSVVRDFGGQPRVVWEKSDGTIGSMKIHDFKNAHKEKMLEVGTDKDGKPTYRPLVDAWLEHPRTPRFENIEFLPGKMPWETRDDVFNLWRGWPDGLPRNRDLREYVVGDTIHEDDEFDGNDEPEEASLFLDHLLENVCGGDGDVYQYLLGWMSDALLRPGHSEVAVIMSGPSGSGKGTFAEFFGSFFGPHFLSTSKQEHVIGKFNRHLMDCQLLFGDEIDFKSNVEANQQLRNLVTEPTMPIEAKGVDVIQARKHFRVIIATNEKHVVGALQDDRRFLVLNVDAGERNRDRDYFAQMRAQWYKGGGRVALFRWLTGRGWQDDLENGWWHVGQRPETKALIQQKDMSLPPAQMIVQNMLATGDVPCEFGIGHRNGSVFVPTQLLADSRRLSNSEITALGRAIGSVAGAGAKNVRHPVAGERRRGYWLPPLELARVNWERALGRSVAWPDDVDSWALEVNEGEGEQPGPF